MEMSILRPTIMALLISFLPAALTASCKGNQPSPIALKMKELQATWEFMEKGISNAKFSDLKGTGAKIAALIENDLVKNDQRYKDNKDYQYMITMLSQTATNLEIHLNEGVVMEILADWGNITDLCKKCHRTFQIEG